jgi:hypothetical protein
MIRLVLQVRESMIQFAGMVVVDNCYGPHGFVLARFPLFLNEGIADHVPDCLGPGGIAFALNVLIKFLAKLTIDGNAETCNI